MGMGTGPGTNKEGWQRTSDWYLLAGRRTEGVVDDSPRDISRRMTKLCNPPPPALSTYLPTCLAACLWGSSWEGCLALWL